MASGSGHGFPPSLRLHFRREFDRVWKEGKKRHSPHFLLIVMRRPCGPTRLGLTVSRKIGGAVARNRVKRLVRECFRLSLSDNSFSADLVVVAKKGAADLSYAEVADELAMLQGNRS